VSPVLSRLARTGLRRGLVDGNRTWLAVGAAAAGFRLLRRLASKQPKVVFSEELAPGTTLLISHGTEAEPEIRPAEG
jgi:hypothetical protein